MKILIIEDSKTINNIAKTELQKYFENIHISQAFTLKEAKGLLQKENFNLVLTDLNLPDGEADEIINEFGKETKFMVLTGDTDFQRRSYLFSEGVIDYYVKNMPIEYTISKIVEKYNQLQKNKNYKILVIDDSSFSRNLLKKVLTRYNFQVETKSTGKNIEKFIKEFNPHLILVDIEMPEIDGFEVIKNIRKVNILTPIIAISGAHNSQNEILTMLKNGANDFISKPFTIESMIIKIEQFIRIEDMYSDLSKANVKLKELVKTKENELKLQEEAMIKQSKQAIMGEMIDYIIHQWRQPLNIMELQLLNFELSNQDNKEALECTTNMSAKISELNEIIGEFRSFFRDDIIEHINLKDELFKITNMIKDLLIKNSVSIDIQGDDIFIDFNKNNLKHIMFILINNSIDAFNEKEIKERKITIKIEDNKLIYEDNAGGIPIEIRDKIFNYNFTTKIDGTGIGLYIVKTLLNKNNLDIIYEPIENGSRFIITL